MHHFALRLVVALLTFGVGIAASSLLNFNSSRKFHRCVAPAPAAVLVAAPSQDELPTQPRPYTENFFIDGGILNDKAISKPQPAYPPIAKAARAQGTVAVRVFVNTDGDVTFTQALSGHPLLQAAAVEAARRAKFAPTRIDGVPVKVDGTLTYDFVLE